MSRIYQGGGADRRFQSNKQSRRYSPTKVQGDVKRIQQEGQAAIQDLQTKDRERVRDNQMSDLESNTADRFAQLQLKQEQIQEQAAFKMQQTVDRFELQNTQRDDKDKLAMQQFADKSKFSLQQTGEQGQLKFEQMSEKINLQNDQMQENLDLGLQRLTTQANAQIEQAQMSADNATANANLAMQKAGVSALLAFADIALKGAELGVQFSEMQDRKAKEEAEKKATQWLFNGGIESATPGIIAAEQSQNQIEKAHEAGIQATGANEIQRENMRAPYADQTMLRDIQQTDIGNATLSFPAQFNQLVNDPNLVVDIGGVPTTRDQLRPGQEYAFLRGVAVKLTSALGISGKEAYGVVQYHASVMNSIAKEQSQLGNIVRGRAKQQRWEMAVGNANTAVGRGDYGRAYEILDRAMNSTGIAGNQKPGAKKDAVWNALKDITPREDLDKLLDIPSIVGQPNTQFRKQEKYRLDIQKTKSARYGIEEDSIKAKQSLITAKAKTIETEGAFAILEAGTNTDLIVQIRDQQIKDLKALGPQGLDALRRVQGQGKTNPNIYAELLSQIDSGQPYNKALVAEALYRQEITPDQAETIKARGMSSDLVNLTLSKAGVPDARKMLEDISKQAMTRRGITGSQPELLRTIVDAEIDNYKNELTALAINSQGADSGTIQQQLQKLNQEIGQRIHKKGDETRLKRLEGGAGWVYDFQGDKIAPIRIDAATGKAVKVYIEFDDDEIPFQPQGASVNDAYLDREQLLDAAEAWRNNSGYSKRVKAISKKLGISPSAFVRRQSTVLGFGRIDKVPPPGRATGDLTIDPELKDALNVLGKYESDPVGGYNAVNQGGADEGRTALGYSGDSSKSALFGYQGASDMSITEIQRRQNLPGGAGSAQFENAGGLWAVGRYQFTSPTLAWVVEKTGISPDTKFTPEVQDYLAGWLLANSHNGIGQWVGPRDDALPHERQLVAKARVKLQDAYRILQNPNATEIQVARAQRTVGNPFI